MTLVAGLRAAAYGIPFQPVAGVHGSDIAHINGWKTVTDPYGSGREVYVVPAIQPDVTVIHATAADEHGNARVLGSPFGITRSPAPQNGCSSPPNAWYRPNRWQRSRS